MVSVEPQPVSEVRKFLSSEDPKILIGTMNVLVFFKDTKTIPLVERLLNHPDEEVGDVAVWCIAEIRGEGTESKT